MIDHVFMHVKDYDRSKRFYTVALKPLGYEVVMEDRNTAGLGAGGEPDFWIGEAQKPQTKVHFAFVAETRKQVDSFYEEALFAGGQDNGGAGVRQHHPPNYHNAVGLDPPRANLAAVLPH